jgi:hypothetical protein
MLEQICNKFGVSIKNTGPYTPQPNGIVPKQFSTYLGQAQSMMEVADFSEIL